MKIELDHQSAISANRSDKKKQPWEIVTQSWKVQAETKGRFAPSICSFLEYAARCYIPVAYASVSWAEKSRVLLAVAVPLTYRQLSAAISTSEATASKIISDLKKMGCRYESQLLLMPAVNNDLFEILEHELRGTNKEGGRSVISVFGGGKKSGEPKAGDVEPVVLSELNRGSKGSDKPSEGGIEEIEPEPGDERPVAGDRIARCREGVEGGITVFY
jgi:hypothetical protein